MTKVTIDWNKEIQPLLKKYGGKKHPLEYKNHYQLIMMVILSAQDSDKHINQVAPVFFEKFPSFESLQHVTGEDLFPLLGKVRNFGNKSNWIAAIAKIIKTEKSIPKTFEELTRLPGIGRKSASVIMREMGLQSKGVIVDLHVVRVAPRIGIVNLLTDPRKIEMELMANLHPKNYEAGMSISFLGRDTCRPTNPKHEECVMNTVCKFYAELKPVKKILVTKPPAKKKAGKKK